MRYIAVFLIGFVAAAPAAAQNMPVSTFLEKADKLRAKGPFALFSSDLRVLKREVESAAIVYRAESRADTAAGKPKDTCPPDKFKLGSDELLNSFRSIPADLRPRTSVKQAWAAFLKRKYPCPK